MSLVLREQLFSRLELSKPSSYLTKGAALLGFRSDGRRALLGVSGELALAHKSSESALKGGARGPPEGDSRCDKKDGGERPSHDAASNTLSEGDVHGGKGVKINRVSRAEPSVKLKTGERFLW